MKNVEILYEDDKIIVINKPAGLAVQGGKGVKTSLDILLAQKFRGEGKEAPLLVHRLDKDTSGVLLAAKGSENAARFSRFINEKKAVKQYIAVCAGSPEKSEGVITEDLLIRGISKKSETKYKVIKNGELTACNLDFSVLEIELGTGRMHQIRRHLAMIGNPILGDEKYGDFALNKKLRKEAGLKRLLLHASRIILKNGYNLNINTNLPDYFDLYIQKNSK
ncbi:MAG: RNA pseudouridine synthase [Treponema sp.]|nr:RNA pseudouridine synthase [Treponema sp.]